MLFYSINKGSVCSRLSIVLSYPAARAATSFGHHFQGMEWMGKETDERCMPRDVFPFFTLTRSIAAPLLFSLL